jgi:transcription initiation factor IIE alpha subunit
MTNQTPLRVFFSCLSCRAVYYTTQEQKQSTDVGRFACKRCDTTVHEWGSQYSFTNWTGPLDKARLRAAACQCSDD